MFDEFQSPCCVASIPMNFSPAISCTILVCQVAVPRVRCAQDKFDHIDRMIDKNSGQLDTASADLVVLPELCTIEYSRQSFERLPWMDEQQTAVHFSPHDEDFVYLNIERSKIEAARQQYTFLEDRLTDYRQR